MCPPEHFGVLYEINPWMHREVRGRPRPGPRRSGRGWSPTLRAAGAEVEVHGAAARGLPDLVFTANAGIVNGRPVRAQPLPPPRAPGRDAATTSRGSRSTASTVDELPDGRRPRGRRRRAAVRRRARCPATASGRDAGAARRTVSTLTGAPCARWSWSTSGCYHLDLTFCPLDDRRAIVAPDGLGPLRPQGGRGARARAARARRTTRRSAFCANSVVVGTNVVMPACPPPRRPPARGVGLRRRRVADVDEFLKAGGGCRCLTLALDVVL